MIRSRLLKRATTVDVTLLTPRTEQQAEALKAVTEVVDKLLVKFHDEGTKQLCETYLNACLSDATGPIDHKFQTKVCQQLVYTCEFNMNLFIDLEALSIELASFVPLRE